MSTTHDIRVACNSQTTQGPASPDGWRRTQNRFQIVKHDVVFSCRLTKTWSGPAAARTGNAFRPGTQRITVALTHLNNLLLAFPVKGLPSQPQFFSLFGEFLLWGYKASKSITNALASIRVFHLNHGLDAGASESPSTFAFFAVPLQLPSGTRAPPLPLAALEKLCNHARRQGPQGLAFAALLSVRFLCHDSPLFRAPPTPASYNFTHYFSFC